MVATATIRERIDARLRAVAGQLSELAEIAADWDTLADLERVDFSLEWDHLMADYLTLLDEWYWAGRMSAGQQTCYRDLLQDLRMVMPIIDRLGLYRPSVLLEA
jgi:hypothetical protein